jgi:hypothetical protein
MSIDPGTSRHGRSGWAVFYSEPTITVTTRYVQTAQARFEVADLHDIVRAHGYAYPGFKVAVVTGLVELALAVPLAAASRSWLIGCAGLLVVAGMVLGVLVDAHRNPRWMELRATHRGRDVVLFSGRDHTEFERVRRALIRAVEANRGPLP